MSKHRSFDYQEIFIQDCKFRGLSESTLKDYEWFLTDVKNHLGSNTEINRQGVKELVLAKLESGQSPATVNHYIRALKAFHSFLHKEGHKAENELAGLSLVSMPEKLKPVLDSKQISQLLSVIPENGFYKARDKVMILMLWDTAMRLKELLNIKLDDIDFKSSTAKITGKGRKDRVVPFGLKTKRELVKYLNIRGENHSEYLYCSRSGKRLLSRNFQRMLSGYGKKIGVKVSPHLLRHSSATFLARNEMPAQHIQILLGHSSLAVTQNYINRIVAQEGLQISHRRLSPGDRI